MSFFKKFFGKNEKTEEKDLSLTQTSNKEEEFEVVDNFLKGSGDLNLNTSLDSRSTKFFKDASDIIGDKPVLEDSAEVLALQSFISHGDNIVEDEETVLIENEEEKIKEEKS